MALSAAASSAFSVYFVKNFPWGHFKTPVNSLESHSWQIMSFRAMFFLHDNWSEPQVALDPLTAFYGQIYARSRMNLLSVGSTPTRGTMYIFTIWSLQRLHSLPPCSLHWLSQVALAVHQKKILMSTKWTSTTTAFNDMTVKVSTHQMRLRTFAADFVLRFGKW